MLVVINIFGRARSRSRSRQDSKEQAESTRGRIPPQKTQSFKGERKPQSWFSRQLSRHMSRTDDSDGEYAAAVAAAAFAISSLEFDTPYQRRPSFGPQSEFGVSSAHFAGKRRDSRRFDESENAIPEANAKAPEKTIHPVPSIMKIPSMKKTPTLKKSLTFEDKEKEDNDSMKPETPIPKPHVPPLLPPSPIPPPPPRTPTFPGLAQEPEADAWERGEMDKVRRRYDKLNATIFEWEDKKRKKAKRELEKTEVRLRSSRNSEIEKRRAKAMHHYQSEIDRIRQIADGARAQAKEKQLNKELKVKEKANKYRATGEPPTTCRCF